MNVGNDFIDHPLLNGNRVSYWFDLLFLSPHIFIFNGVCVGHNTTVVYALNPTVKLPNFYSNLNFARVGLPNQGDFVHLLTMVWEMKCI